MNRVEIVLAVVAAKKAKKYLEIGVLRGDVFNNINCYKLGIDPNPQIRKLKDILRITSDEFFEKVAKEEDFDVIFIDGDHSAKQVAKDVSNCLKFYPDAVILLHDTNPVSEADCKLSSRGDGFKVCDWIKQNKPDIDMFTTTLEEDFMTAIICRSKTKCCEVYSSSISWGEFSQRNEQILNFVSNQDFIKRCL